ncbi:MAG: glycoside hydrolase family 13 protein [Bacteroidota bacterium]
MRALLFLLVTATLVACTDPAPDTVPPGEPAVPEWTRGAVWYQIFPERFRNGDPSNDPTIESIRGAYPHTESERLLAAGWQPTPWTHDWYAQEGWAQRLGEPFYTTVQLRRYGGDLQGMLDGLPYLDSLGVTALYLNPMNDAPSLHKYDARVYRHIDPHFGPDPEGDKAIIAAEDPLDPATWQFTAADRLFLDFVEAAHAQGLKVVLDYSWNHTGQTFWAWRDVLENQQASPYASWYKVDAWDDPATPDTSEFAYTGWAGVPTLPEIRKVNQTGNPAEGIPYDGNLDPEAVAHIEAVTRRWLDPNGDGDPSDGLDGFRLDVAEQVPLGFWRDYYRFVKAINPDAYLVGEIWWERWPHHMSDIRPYLGDVFDGVMHYRWYKPTRGLLVGGPDAHTPSAWQAHIDSLFVGVDEATRQGLMQLGGSHDTPRIATSLYNPERGYKDAPTPTAHAEYRIDQPDAATFRSMRLLALMQFTLPGAPHLFYGDEVGMWGADDPDMRKPMLWPAFTYATETTHPFGEARAPDPVARDTDLFAFYRSLTALRAAHPSVFATGDLAWLQADDDTGVIAYQRLGDGERALVVLNTSEAAQTFDLGDAANQTPDVTVDAVTKDGTALQLPPRSGAVLVGD